MSAPENSPPLRCDAIRPLLSAYMDRETTTMETARIKEHLSGCAACTSYLVFLETANHALRAAPQYHPSPNLFARIAQATYARPTFGQRVAAWLRPAPVRIALGSALAVGIVAAVVVPMAGRLHPQDAEQAPTTLATALKSNKTDKHIAQKTPAAAMPSVVAPSLAASPAPVEVATTAPTVPVTDSAASKSLATNSESEREPHAAEHVRTNHGDAVLPRHSEIPSPAVLPIPTKPVLAKVIPHQNPASIGPAQRQNAEQIIANLPVPRRPLASLMDRHLSSNRLNTPSLPDAGRVHSEIPEDAIHPETRRPVEVVTANITSSVAESVTAYVPNPTHIGLGDETRRQQGASIQSISYSRASNKAGDGIVKLVTADASLGR